MQEENVTPEAVKPQEQVVAEEPVREEPVEQPSEEPSQEPSQEPQPGDVVEPEYDIREFLPQQQQNFDIKPDDDGYIDPAAFYNKVMTDVERRFEEKQRFEAAERQAWSNVEKKYPEIKQDPELRDILNAQRLADVARGGKGDLNQIAGRLLGKLQSYQNRGKAQAQVSEKVQKSAALQRNTANNVETSSSSDLMERMSRGDEAAKEQLISEWLEQGKLQDLIRLKH